LDEHIQAQNILNYMPIANKRSPLNEINNPKTPTTIKT
jgi:hypothetical protein